MPNKVASQWREQVLSNRYFRIAQGAMLESDYSIRVGACLVVGNGVFVAAHNHNTKTHPLIRRFYPDFIYSVHAELQACLTYNTHCHGVMKNAVMYIYREDRHGVMKTAKPCIGCRAVMSYFGIRTAYYSLPDGYGTLFLG